jgi:hypothetical protein
LLETQDVQTWWSPNITFEPRKPVNLGSQLKNGAECLTGIFAFQDIVQAPEIQKRKKYYYSNEDTQCVELTELPNSPMMQAHTAEVLRQVEGAGVKAGGWVGGDARFGSVMTAVEVKRRLGVHSTMIIKGHTHLFPMQVLHAILQGRHGTRPAGHWVTVKTTIAGRDQSCLDEHHQAEAPLFACNTLHVKKAAVPESAKIDFFPRRGKRTSVGR